MSIIFYPHDDDMNITSVKDRLEILLEAAERFKAMISDPTTSVVVEDVDDEGKKKSLTPRNIRIAFNWQELAKLLREIRELPENNTTSKATKADRLGKLSEIYEVLRSAKMPKLEAVRLAIMNEANQLRSGTASVPK